jgi:hypothetical protein
LSATSNSLATPTGDGFDFQIDSTRVYAYGLSLGSAAPVSHYPDIFAAGATSVGWLDNASYEFRHVEACNSEWADAHELDMVLRGHERHPPMIYTFGSLTARSANELHRRLGTL